MRHRTRSPFKRRTVLVVSIAGATSLTVLGGAMAAQDRSPEHRSRTHADADHHSADRHGHPAKRPDRAASSLSANPTSTAESTAGSAATAPSASVTTAPPKLPACGTGHYVTEAVQDGRTWTARRGDTVLYKGEEMATAITNAIEGLGPDRTSEQRVVFRGSGTMPASWRLRLHNYTTLDVCGTITTTGEGANTGAVHMRGVHEVEIQHLKLAGSATYGIFARNVGNLTLGDIEIDGTYIGVRIDNLGDRSAWTENVDIGKIAVNREDRCQQRHEPRGGDLRRRRLHRRLPHGPQRRKSGLLLNQTINAEIGTVDAVDAGTGTGYAAFRLANGAGRIDDAYPTNVHVKKVVARGGGRGVFCVSQSGGAVIDEVDIAGTGSNAVLVENCYNLTIGAKGGTIAGPGDMRISARADFPNTENVTFENLTLRNTAVNERPCAANTVTRNLKLVHGTVNTC